MTNQPVSIPPERWQELFDVADRALELDLAERAAFVEQCSRDDPALGAELRALLEGAETASALDSSAAAFAGPLLAELCSEPDQLASAVELISTLRAALAGQYAIERELGHGGMATVYLARDLKHEREVALKVLRPDLALAMSTQRFLQEIRITAQLNHPHILTLIDSGETDGFLWYVLPYIRGESLRVKLSRDKQLGLEEALKTTRQIASALDYAHRHAVIHRDIKPENILLHEGEAMLADFGIALAVEEASGSRLSQTGISPGTPQYMSPEQASGRREVDARSDVYSLALVVYEMLTGTPPHTGATAQAIIAKMLAERPTPIRTVRGTVPESIDNAVAKALAKVPADRFAQAGEFADALSATTRSRSRWWPGAWSWASRPRRIVAMAGLAVVAVLVSLLVRDRWIGVQPAPALYRQITASGRATSPALSRNGQFLAFLDSGRLYVRSLAAGGSEVPVIGESEASRWGNLHSVEWSADGAKLFLYADSGTYILPALGGTAQRATRWSGRFAAMSPRGDRVAEWHSGGLVRVRDLTSSAVDTVPVPGTYTWLIGVTWSPQANALVVMTTDGDRRYTMRLLDLRRRNGRVLLEDSVVTSVIAWNGEAGAIYYVRWVYPVQLWKLPMSAGTAAAAGRPAMVIPRLDAYEFSTADDGTLAFTRDASISNVWVGWVQGDTTRRWLTTGTTSSSFPRFSPDGRRVAFIREDGASANLFVAGTDSGAPQQLTFLDDRVAGPTWSANGDRIAFCHGYSARPEAPPGIGIVPAVGGPVVWPTTPRNTSVDCEIGWLSADEVLYHQVGNRNFGVVSLRGGPPRRLVANDSVGWMFSAEPDPAGRFVAIYWNWRVRDGIWLVTLADSSQRLLYQGHFMPRRWLATGDVLYAREIWSPFRLIRIPIAAPESTTTVGLSHPCPNGISDVSSDGSRIVCAEGAAVSDIWTVRDFDPTRRPPRRRP